MNRDNYRDKYLFNNYMQKAIEVAERQFRNQKVKNCNPYAEVPIGCVIVNNKNGQINNTGSPLFALQTLPCCVVS